MNDGGFGNTPVVVNGQKIRQESQNFDDIVIVSGV